MLKHNLLLLRLLRRLACAGLFLGVLSCRSAEQPAPGPEVKLQVLDEAKFADTLKQYRGKVVLVDYWALWCSPCRELFPHTVQLSRELSGRGLAVVSVNLDEAEKEPDVLKFLVSQKAALHNYIAKGGGSGETFALLQIDDGTLPHLKLFDREGNLRNTFPKPHSGVNTVEVDEAVRDLLGRGADGGTSEK